jgi:hypothetical protein
VTQRCKPQTINLDLVAERIPRRKRGRGVWMDSAPKKCANVFGISIDLIIHMCIYIYICVNSGWVFFAIDQSQMLGHFEIAALTSCHLCCRRCQVSIIQLSHVANWKTTILTVGISCFNQLFWQLLQDGFYHVLPPNHQRFPRTERTLSSPTRVANRKSLAQGSQNS